MISDEQALALSQEWVHSWNSRDLEKIMSHYDDEVEFFSPMIVKIMEKEDGKITGKENLKVYFQKGLATYPDLHFTIYNVLAGIESITLHYRSVKNLQVAEVMFLNAGGKISKVYNHYAEAKD